jgi:methylated-DNA-[protein]-cysteine S-methyltransferase
MYISKFKPSDATKRPQFESTVSAIHYAQFETQIHYTQIESPLGPLLLAAGDSGVHEIRFLNGRTPQKPESEWVRDDDDKPLCELAEQLDAYFSGKLEKFELTLSPLGTSFQRSVWSRLCDIPYGETISYGEIARRIGNPQASRAVGLANGSNPIPIVIPCHRVVGSNGKLTGYGGGLPIKEKLLALERRQLTLL